jgi:hypothetical protein
VLETIEVADFPHRLSTRLVVRPRLIVGANRAQLALALSSFSEAFRLAPLTA